MEKYVLYEDENIKVAEKPAGTLSYPLPKGDEKTIGDLLGAYPVHRLDRDTSGILLMVKSQEDVPRYQKMFSERKVKKTYQTLVWGKVEPERGEIVIPLGRGSKDRLKVVPKGSGKISRTLYVVEKYYENPPMSLLEIELKTGRTHQIRVHMSAIGHPIVGDKKYSKKESGLRRQFLHATKLEFTDPKTGKKMIFWSKTPEDLRSFIASLD